jgi:hypothetical protein
MAIRLGQILDLVGKLDDAEGGDTPRERFRRFLAENVSEVGQLRDHIEECLRIAGDQYNRALQDLINHLGTFLGFEVEFGRYRGVRGQVGFDGHWKSPLGYHIVVETKTTEAYAIKTASLVGYVDELISEKKIPNWEKALGLYIVGRPDPGVRQLENAIIAERRTQQLRIASVDSLLSLAEIMAEYDVAHDDLLAVLRPSGPAVDAVVDLMGRLAAQRLSVETAEVEADVEEAVGAEAKYWLSPVKSDKQETAEDVIQKLVGEESIYAYGERTPGRKHLNPGNWICFYATGTGVIAHARVASKPEKRIHPKVRNAEKYPWVFGLDNARLYLREPVVLDAAVRARLEAFKGRDAGKSWSWFVQATRRVSRSDFETLTRR